MKSHTERRTRRPQSQANPPAKLRPVVHIVDDEAAVRQSTAELLRLAGREVIESSSGDAFLSTADLQAPGCVVLDLNMPGVSGMGVLKSLKDLASPLGVVIVSGHADIPIAVEAMRLDAIDVLEKPYEPQRLLDVVSSAIQRSVQRAGGQAGTQARRLVASLTPREREVLGALVGGATNSEIAECLSLSPRTVEMHRANLMKRLAVHSLPDALRIAYEAGLRVK